MIQESLNSAVVVYLNPVQAGFICSHMWKDLLATCGCSSVSPSQYSKLEYNLNILITVTDLSEDRNVFTGPSRLHI